MLLGPAMDDSAGLGRGERGCPSGIEQVLVARDVRSADAVHIGVVSLWEFIFKQHLGP
jgi:hypothetical protein